ncbi:TolC family outer membrane protein [Novosphingopyxis sp.]|uniref:TolC family outer membrane protein n=1 Tax=Novosphingopyxis sp. TaxID=2709690 RepID=UPI003B5B4D32
MIEGRARSSLLLSAALAAAAPAQAETLREAIALAYATNPVLAEARARQAALEEAPEQARADGRPTLSADVGAGYNNNGIGNAGNANLRVTLPIWTGGRVPSAVRAANADVAAGEQRVRDREAAVLERVVTAYADLLFAQASVEVARIGIERLDRQVDEARSRFDLGEATLTDVAQLRAQRANVLASLADAEAALTSAAATYRAVVGQSPGDLVATVSPPDALPTNLPEARLSAEEANPLLLEQTSIADASAARILRARAVGAPSLDLAAGYGRGAQLSGGGLRGFESEAMVGLSLNLPIFTGGLVPSRVREAEATYSAERFATESVEREVIRVVDTAWAALEAAQLRLQASRDGLEAAELALDGVRAEYEFGLRSTIDILLADQSYRAAQLALARSQSDELIAQANLLRAAGRLDEGAYL